MKKRKKEIPIWGWILLGILIGIFIIFPLYNFFFGSYGGYDLFSGPGGWWYGYGNLTSSEYCNKLCEVAYSGEDVKLISCRDTCDLFKENSTITYDQYVKSLKEIAEDNLSPLYGSM